MSRAGTPPAPTVIDQGDPAHELFGVDRSICPGHGVSREDQVAAPASEESVGHSRVMETEDPDLADPWAPVHGSHEDLRCGGVTAPHRGPRYRHPELSALGAGAQQPSLRDVVVRHPGHSLPWNPYHGEVHPASRTVELAGLAVQMDLTEPWLARYLDWHFGPLLNTAETPSLTISPAGGDLGDPPDVVPRREGPVDSWEADGCLWIRHQTGARAVLRDAQLQIAVVDGPEAWRAVRQLLFTGLSWFLDGRGLLLLHAGLISRDSRGILLMGPSSSGKSTATISALLAGWQLHSDDLTVIEVGETPRAFGIPKRAMVEPAVARLLSGDLLEVSEPGRSRVMLPPDVFTGGWRELAAVVTLDHDDDEGQLDRVPHGDALAELVRGFLEAERPDAMRRHLSGLAALAGLSTFRLAHAAEPSRRMDRAAQLLGEALGAALTRPGAQ